VRTNKGEASARRFPSRLHDFTRDKKGDRINRSKVKKKKRNSVSARLAEGL